MEDNKFSALWRKIVALFEGKPTERALAMSALYEQADRLITPLKMWLTDLYIENGMTFAIASDAGRLIRFPLIVDGVEVMLGTPAEVEQMFEARQRSAFTMIRQADGQARWFAVAAAAVLNRVGEIDSRALFDDFVARARTEGYPTLDFFHHDALNFGRADWLARDGNLLMASGVFDADSPLTAAMIAANEAGRGRWGCSVAYDPTREPAMLDVGAGVTIPVYDAGILRKIAVLPETDAASWFTALEVKRTMDDRMREALVTLFGDEAKANEFILGVDDVNRAIEQRGLIARDGATAEVVEAVVDVVAEPVTDAATVDAQPDTEPEQAREIEVSDSLLDAILARVPQPATVDLSPLQLSLDALAAQMAEVSVRLEGLERSDEAKRQRWMSDLPARATAEKITATYRPSVAKSPDAGKPVDMGSVAAASLSRLPQR
jgi:hypothetical protein